MKATGVVRKIDDLGRIVVPMEIRKNFELPEGTPIEVFVDQDRIVLRKYNPGCHFCGGHDQLVERGKNRICSSCLADFVEAQQGSSGSDRTSYQRIGYDSSLYKPKSQE